MSEQVEASVEKAARSKKKTKVGPKAEGKKPEKTTEAGSTDEPHEIDEMRGVAAVALGENCLEIARAIAKRSVEEADVRRAKFLCDLAGEKKELIVTQAKRIMRSLAEEWENEPAWTAVIEEAKADSALSRMGNKGNEYSVGGDCAGAGGGRHAAGRWECRSH